MAKNRHLGGGWFRLPRGKKPAATAPQQGALVRLAHPKNPELHPDHRLWYSQQKGEWVQIGYTKWKVKDWHAKFGSQHDEGRKWEFFGYVIPLYDEDDERTSQGKS